MAKQYVVEKNGLFFGVSAEHRTSIFQELQPNAIEDREVGAGEPYTYVYTNKGLAKHYADLYGSATVMTLEKARSMAGGIIVDMDVAPFMVVSRGVRGNGSVSKRFASQDEAEVFAKNHVETNIGATAGVYAPVVSFTTKATAQRTAYTVVANANLAAPVAAPEVDEDKRDGQ